MCLYRESEPAHSWIIPRNAEMKCRRSSILPTPHERVADLVCTHAEATEADPSSIPPLGRHRRPPARAQQSGGFIASQPFSHPSSSSCLSSCWSLSCLVAGVADVASEGKAWMRLGGEVAMVNLEASIGCSTRLARCRAGMGEREDAPRPLVISHAFSAAGV